jgi:hypothetical protein
MGFLALLETRRVRTKDARGPRGCVSSRSKFVQQDEEKRKLALSRRGDAAWKAELTYEYPTPDTWTISGTFGGRNLKVDLRRGEVPKFLLMERGFHWINEFPYNY